MRATPLWISLLWSLVEVHCQTAPYVSFMGENLPNHSYVDLTLVGSPAVTPSDHAVQCHTDLQTCCTSHHGPYDGDWYFPHGRRLAGYVVGDITQQHGAQRVDLRRNHRASKPPGIYRCFIATNAVHADDDGSVRETVYVGLYATGGKT